MIHSITVGIPETVLDRSQFEPKQLAQFERLTGIKKTRRFEGSTREMISKTVEAGRDNLRLEKVGAVIVVTQSPDRLSPCMAVDVHKQLGLGAEVPCFDVNQSCDGLVYGLWIASKIMLGEGKSDVILVCADRLRYSKTPLESLIFSDACAVIQVGKGFGSKFFFDTDGSLSEKLYSKLDGSMDMDGAAVFDKVNGAVPELIKKVMDFTWLEVSYLVPHPANLSMIKTIEKRTGFEGRTLHAIEEYGNQSMVGIATSLVVHIEKLFGKNVLLVGYGAGFCSSAVVVPFIPGLHRMKIVELS
jgi:3-oxoacyl-[acyl-carrier-protein] synthase-3